MLVLIKIIELFVVIGIGFYLGKTEIISEEVSKKLSYIIVTVANPAIILNAVSGDALSKFDTKSIVVAVIVAFGTFFVLMLLAEVIIRILQVKHEDRGMYRDMLIFSNIGYMGLPLAHSLLGPESVVYVAIFQIPFNVLIYTYGIIVMCPANGTREKLKLRNIFNNGTIACIILLMILFFKLKLPAPVEETISILSGMVVPVSMMIIGASLATVKIRELVEDGRLYLLTIIKQILIPVFGYFVLKNLIQDELLLSVSLIMLACPIGSFTAMLAHTYGGDVKLASKGIAFTTIISAITIPLVFLITGQS